MLQNDLLQETSLHFQMEIKYISVNHYTAKLFRKSKIKL